MQFSNSQRQSETYNFKREAKKTRRNPTESAQLLGLQRQWKNNDEKYEERRSFNNVYDGG